MPREKFSRFVKCAAAFFIFILITVVAAKTDAAAGMLVAQGKRTQYVADQEEGILFAVYADGEWVRVAEDLGHISGLAACSDNSVYIMSRTHKKLLRVAPDGVVQLVRKVRVVPEAIYVDRDGLVYFVERSGVVRNFE